METQENPIQVEVTLTSSQLYRYNLYHCYRNSSSGVFSILLGVFCLCYAIGFHARMEALYVLLIAALGVLFLIYNPISLFLRSKNRFLNNDALQKPIVYSFDERGITLSQADAAEQVEWEQVYRAVDAGDCIYLYFTRIHANIIPKSAMGDSCEALCRLMKAHTKTKGMKL